MSDEHLLGYGDRQPLFEIFPLSREGRDPVGAGRRISILQRAKCNLLAQPLGTHVIPLSLVPSGRLRMRSLQLLLRHQWDFVDESVILHWSPEISSDPTWWSDASHLLSSVSLVPFQPDVLFWSNASDQGWGANLLDQFVSGQWSPEEAHLSINLRELRATRLGLRHFAPSLRGHTVGVFADNTTALAYLRRQGGTFSPALNREAQLLLCWAQSLQILLVSQFIMESRNVVADSLSRWDQTIGSEWTLAQQVVLALQRRWQVTVDLFATALDYRLPVYFSPLNDPMAAGTDAFLQSWDHLQANAFPSFSLIHQVLSKLQSSRGTLLTLIAPL